MNIPFFLNQSSWVNFWNLHIIFENSLSLFSKLIYLFILMFLFMEISIFIFMKIYPIYGVYHIYFIYNQSNTYSQFKHSWCLTENIFLSPSFPNSHSSEVPLSSLPFLSSSSFLYKFTSMFINNMISLFFFLFFSLRHHSTLQGKLIFFFTFPSPISASSSLLFPF